MLISEFTSLVTKGELLNFFEDQIVSAVARYQQPGQLSGKSEVYVADYKSNTFKCRCCGLLKARAYCHCPR